MSCTAIAKCTWFSRSFSVFCGTLNTGPKSAGFLHQRKVFGRQRLQREAALAALQDQLVLAAIRLTVWSSGMVRRMSISLRAPTVVVKLPLSPSSSAVVRIWISRSLVVNSTPSAGLANQHVGQDRQGVPALHDARHRLQRREQLCLALPSGRSCLTPL